MALCREMRQVVVYYIGDRSEESCRELLWERVLPEVMEGDTSQPRPLQERYERPLPQAGRVDEFAALARETCFLRSPCMLSDVAFSLSSTSGRGVLY